MEFSKLLMQKISAYIPLMAYVWIVSNNRVKQTLKYYVVPLHEIFGMLTFRILMTVQTWVVICNWSDNSQNDPFHVNLKLI